jgi:hypothetical protein
MGAGGSRNLMSDFAIKIVRKDGKPVLLKPGAQGERDFIEAIRAKGVGWFKSEAQVVSAIKQVLWELKSEVVPPA